MSKRVYRFTSEPTGAVYRDLVDYAAARSNFGLLVVRSDLGLDGVGQNVLASLEPFVERHVRANQWPGTELLDAEADLFYFRLLLPVVHCLKASTNRLFGWQQPMLPEDLCFLDDRERPWLVTISHEEEAYVCLTEDDKRSLGRALPTVWAALRHDKQGYEGTLADRNG